MIMIILMILIVILIILIMILIMINSNDNSDYICTHVCIYIYIYMYIHVTQMRAILLAGLPTWTAVSRRRAHAARAREKPAAGPVRPVHEARVRNSGSATTQ